LAVSTNPRIILYNPPSSENRKPVVPMSLLALGALLEGEHDYLIFDGNLEPDPAVALDRAIVETGTDLLAMTVMPGPQLNHSAPLCRDLKQRHPGLTIVWGGYFPTQHADSCLRSEYVDYVVRGHGEVAFKALVEVLRQRGDPTAIPGLVFRNTSTGEVVANPMGPIPHPDRLPDYPYHRVDLSRYVRRTFMGSRTLPHHSSYGCPFRCSFCAVVSMTDGCWLAQSAERAAAVVRRLVTEHGADSVEFYDNNFFVHEARTLEFSERIKEHGIGWWGEARIDTLLGFSERTWAAMRESGLRMVFMGAESGSDETLRLMNKGGTASAEKTLEIARKMRSFGIVPELSFVLGNPPDPEADVRHTLEFIRRVKKVNPDSEIVLYIYTPVPLANELYEQVEAEGFRFPETLEEWISPEWQRFSQRRSDHLPWVPNAVHRKVRDFQRVLNARYPTATDPRLGGPWRWMLKGASAWRYALRLYDYPLELRALQRLVRYQRPETSGF
jgi:anaerobic magnesium-protoporphyrin IX monomethyl ester cyclase